MLPGGDEHPETRSAVDESLVPGFDGGAPYTVPGINTELVDCSIV